MAVTTSSTLTSLTSYIQRTGLERAKPNLIYSDYGKKITIPQKNSKTIKFRRYERISPTTGAQLATLRSLSEGVIPNNTTPSITDYTATVAQYGQVFQWSDIAEWTNEVSVDTELMAVNSENMAQTSDCVVRDNLMAGTNVFRLTDAIGGVSGAARVNVAGPINAAALDKAIRNLKASDTKYWKDGISASNKIGTSAVRPSYVMLIHPYVEYDLEQVPGYKAVSDYGDQSSLLKGEVGAYKNIRFVTSTLAKYFPDAGATKAGTWSTTGTDSDVFACLLVGMDAYAVIDLASTSEIIYNPQSEKSKVDPANQYATLAWKAMLTALILNDNWILRFECVANN